MKRLAYLTISLALALALPAVPAWGDTATAVIQPDGRIETGGPALFDGLDGLMPGASWNSALMVRNESESAQELMLEIRVDEPAALLDEAELVIKAGDATFYHGALSGTAAGGPILLGTIEAGAAKEIAVEVALSAEAGNALAMRDGSFSWQLSAAAVGGAAAESAKQAGALPKTADRLALPACCLAAFATLLAITRRREHA